jgi:uncharacterized membrane protein
MISMTSENIGGKMPGELFATLLPNAWGAPNWLIPAIVLVTIGIALLLWSYLRSNSPIWLRTVSMILKTAGLVLLALILLEPKTKTTRPEKGANSFVVMADKSESLSIKDPTSKRTRGQQLAAMLDDKNKWLTRIDNDFDLRRYTFDARLHAVNDFTDLTADSSGSNIVGSLEMLADRLQGKPCGGILLFTDGNATDLENSSIDWSTLPPIYPVVLGSEKTDRDITISRVAVSQTNFETSPVTITAELDSQGFNQKSIDVQLLDAQGNELQRKTVTNVEDNKKFAVRFEVKPEGRGLHFYQVRAFEKSKADQFENAADSREATLINNTYRVSVDRGQGPYRILYVSGRPNWEFKFLNRALQKDPEVELAGLIRVARKEPKFSFRGHIDEATNPLYRGFGNKQDQTAEQYDQPVLIRLGVNDKTELRDGFPKNEDELFKYDAVIIDDLEAAFFTQDQKSLLQHFVSIRGGSLLMLGGQESFVRGDYDRTPIGEMLPVYLDKAIQPPADNYQLVLTREGWLQPWVRVRSTEDAEKIRLAKMPAFQTVNRIRSIKPGATILARVATKDGQSYPALVVQKFGKGHAGAMLIGDLWRWQMHDSENNDLMKSWRQTTRWLVSDVPRRIEVESKPNPDARNSTKVQIRVRDETYKPLDNATIKIKVTPPATAETSDANQKTIELTAIPSEEEAGLYEASVVSRQSGNYLGEVSVLAPDGSALGKRQTGWVHQPGNEELRDLKPNRQFLQSIADQTGGKIVAAKSLDRFARSIPANDDMISRTEIRPWWHHWQLFMAVIALLVAEWGLRRWKGLP